MTLQNAIATYKEQVESIPEHEWLEWVRAVNAALVTGNESLVMNLHVWLEWVPAVYQALKAEMNGGAKIISMADEKDKP